MIRNHSIITGERRKDGKASNSQRIFINLTRACGGIGRRFKRQHRMVLLCRVQIPTKHIKRVRGTKTGNLQTGSRFLAGVF